MIKSNGGIIGPDNVTTGGFNGVASGVFKLGEVTDLIRQSKWPEPSPFTNTVPNSVRFNSGSSDYLTKSFSTTGNRQKFTLSMWIKRGIVPVGNQSGTERMLFQAYQDSSNQDQIWLQSNGTINYVRNDANAVTPSQVLRDPSAWYHLVFAGDTTQGSNANRLKVYVNGTQAPIGQGDTIAQNSNFGAINNAQSYTFGKRNSNDWYFDGSMSHIHMVDGTAYPASTFGSVDSVTGEWKINTSPSVTYGNNGFFILKDGNSVTDQSGKNNNFSVGGSTLTATKDCPSNVFATWNPLVNNAGEMMLLSNGNTSCQSNAAQGNSWKLAASTLGMTSGKYYWEAKLVNTNNNLYHGVMGSNVFQANASNPMNATGFTGWNNGDGGEILKDGNNTSANYGTLADNDILGVALNADDYTISIYKNGSALVSNFTLSTTGRDILYPCSVAYNTNNTGIPQSSYNFGNPAYALTSAVADANGLGNFEYAPPTGYFSLCTNNLNVLE